MKHLIEIGKNKILSTIETINWSIVIALIAAGVSSGIVAGIIFLYLFAACAHITGAFRTVKSILRIG